MTRVVVEGFDSLYALGLQDIIGVEDVEFCRAGGGGVSALLRRSLPRVVLLNASLGTTAALVDELVHDYPGITVITCSPDTAEMQVYPAFHRGESFHCPLEPTEIDRQVHR